jgi:hypothetical protein
MDQDNEAPLAAQAERAPQFDADQREAKLCELDAEPDGLRTA